MPTQGATRPSSARDGEKLRLLWVHWGDGWFHCMGRFGHLPLSCWQAFVSESSFLGKIKVLWKERLFVHPCKIFPCQWDCKILQCSALQLLSAFLMQTQTWTSWVPGRALRTPRVPSCEVRASQVLHNLTMPSNLCTHLCIQAENKHKKDSPVSYEATGMSITLRDQQYHTLQSGEVLAYPTGKAVPSLTGAVMTSASIPFILTSHTEQQHNLLDSSRLFLSRCISNRKRKRNILIN